MKSMHLAFSALGAAGLTLTGLGALPAHASADLRGPGDTCRITISSVKALDAGESNGDEIFLRLGSDRTATRHYDTGTKRLLGAEDVFVGSESVRLVEHDSGGNEVLASVTVPCANDFGTTDVSSPGGTAEEIYRVEWTVEVS